MTTPATAPAPLRAAPPSAPVDAGALRPRLRRRLPARTTAVAGVTAFVMFVVNVYVVSRGEHLWDGPVRVVALALCCLALAAAAWAPRHAVALAAAGLLTFAATGAFGLFGYLAAVGAVALAGRTDRRAAAAGAGAVAAFFGLGLAVPDAQGADTMPSFSDPPGALLLLGAVGVVVVGAGLLLPRRPLRDAAPGLPFLGRLPVVTAPEVLVVAVVVAVVALRSTVLFASSAMFLTPTGELTPDGDPVIGTALLSPLGTTVVVGLFCLFVAAVALTPWFPRSAFAVVLAVLAGEIAFSVSGGVLYVPPLTAGAVIALYVLGRALLGSGRPAARAGGRLVLPLALTVVATALLTSADLLAGMAREASAFGETVDGTPGAYGGAMMLDLFLRALAGSAVPAVLAVAAAWLVTRWLADRERLATSATREAAAAERTRIARELHDVVAHHVSLVTVRAESAPFLVPDLPAPARDAFGEIATTSRRALDELRDVLAVLGRDGDPALAPQPTLADVPGLVETARRAGTSVAFGGVPDTGDVPAATALAAHAVVREGLSNARRHAPGAPVSVALATDGDELVVEVSNGLDAAPGPEQVGLAGLRERAAAAGGTFTAGAADGRFAVVARLPMRRAEAS